MNEIDLKIKEKKTQLCDLRRSLRTFQAELARHRDARPDTAEHLRGMQINIEAAEDDLIDLEEKRRATQVTRTK